MSQRKEKQKLNKGKETTEILIPMVHKDEAQNNLYHPMQCQEEKKGNSEKLTKTKTPKPGHKNYRLFNSQVKNNNGCNELIRTENVPFSLSVYHRKFQQKQTF